MTAFSTCQINSQILLKFSNFVKIIQRRKAFFRNKLHFKLPLGHEIRENKHVFQILHCIVLFFHPQEMGTQWGPWKGQAPLLWKPHHNLSSMLGREKMHVQIYVNVLCSLGEFICVIEAHIWVHTVMPMCVEGRSDVGCLPLLLSIYGLEIASREAHHFG